MVIKNFKVTEFRYARATDKTTTDFNFDGVWSRPYEYSYVIDFIKKINTPERVLSIHNSSWGYEGVHILFREELDKIGDCTHSDILISEKYSTIYYNIVDENIDWFEKFDIVINVSTIEHLNTNEERIAAINNLFNQVKKSGYLILTFDYPRVNLSEIESLVGSRCKLSKNRLNGENSINSNIKYKNLNIVYLILQKI